MLHSKGHKSEEYNDGFYAVEAMKNNPSSMNYDVILMDFIMPLMDGPSATRELHLLGCSIPVIGLTGNGLPSDVKRFLDSGVYKVLIKPLNLDDFHKIMIEIKLNQLNSNVQQPDGEDEWKLIWMFDSCRIELFLNWF